MIPIRNIYYMLSYAFQILKEQGFREIETERFDNVADLCAAILAKGIAHLVKRGLGKAYLEHSEPLSTLRGKIEIAESLQKQTIQRKQQVCTFDEFDVNMYLNQIIKSTVTLLLHADIAKDRKQALRRLMAYFADVSTLDVRRIQWNVRYDKSNQVYQMIVSICNLVVKGLLQTNAEGPTKLMDYLDEQRMSRLYEKFILEYYRKEHPTLSVEPSQIAWALDEGIDASLPIMQSDVTIRSGNYILIIDAKYYSRNLQIQYDIPKIHSANLYQIFTYVKNKSMECKSNPCVVSGLLLYAKTDEAVQPNASYTMSGNRIGVSTLDMSGDFASISIQLDMILFNHGITSSQSESSI